MPNQFGAQKLLLEILLKILCTLRLEVSQAIVWQSKDLLSTHLPARARCLNTANSPPILPTLGAALQAMTSTSKIMFKVFGQMNAPRTNIQALISLSVLRAAPINPSILMIMELTRSFAYVIHFSASSTATMTWRSPRVPSSNVVPGIVPILHWLQTV